MASLSERLQCYTNTKQQTISILSPTVFTMYNLKLITESKIPIISIKNIG